MRAEQAHYRPDLDGLRAVAVIAVVLFHAFPDLAPGGFIGVDVFFVISGFLITGLIFTDIEAGHFSFGRFYARRARRILPMLVVIVLVSAVVGYVLLYPGDYRAFGSSAIAALLGWSNFFFLHNTGYFDIPSQTMPLLHTWSLGVEEQFYLIWPAIILLGCKFVGLSRRAWVALLTVVILTSFYKALATAAKSEL
jgi:peptidoglycan/LPS O-acetylase OafA/YrhL